MSHRAALARKTRSEGQDRFGDLGERVRSYVAAVHPLSLDELGPMVVKMGIGSATVIGQPLSIGLIPAYALACPGGHAG